MVRLPWLRRLPVLGLAELRRTSREQVRKDVLVGLSVSAVAVPASMGMAELAGLPPVTGLYATMLPLVAYALVGSSRHMVTGPEGALATLTVTTVAPLAGGDAGRYAALAAALALLVGGVMFAGAAARIGFMADFLSKPVLIGYLNGTALIIIVSQLGKLLGIKVTASDFFPQLAETLRKLGQAHGATVLLSASLLAVMVLLRRFAPGLPASLIVVAAADLASAALDLKHHGVSVVGPVSGGFPVPRLPDVGLNDLLKLALPAAGMAMVAFGDAVATVRTYAAKHHYETSAGRELAGLGAANIVAGFTRAFPCSCSGSRTAVADASGGGSQVVGITTAAVAALVAAFGTALIEPLPKAALGVVVVAAAVNLLDAPAVLRLRRVHDTEAAIAVAAMLAVLAFGVLGGLAVAIALSIGVFVYRTVRPHDAVLGEVEDVDGYHDIDRYGRADTVPGLIVYRFDAPLYFPNAPFFVRRLKELLADPPGPVRWLLLNAESVTYLDSTAVDALKELQKELAEQLITLAVARAKGPLRDVLESAGLVEVVGPEHFFPTVRAGVHAYLDAYPDSARERGTD